VVAGVGLFYIEGKIFSLLMYWGEIILLKILPYKNIAYVMSQCSWVSSMTMYWTYNLKNKHTCIVDDVELMVIPTVTGFKNLFKFEC
jgi:hypothetical protein